ncbi:hypothetical protein [Clostridium sp. Ade.TY]|uniref:hypothetical protein n=1 Tax=Clostridium sp. Ade.TY TaxID=1391647 RepID=UPI000424E770|nr:hypothetical protein [Clostridium sp. Ade.TY]
MDKKELYKQIECLHHDLKKFESIKSDKNLLGNDIKALEAVMDLIMLGAGAFTTDELVSELMKRNIENVLQNLDDGAVD